MGSISLPYLRAGKFVGSLAFPNTLMSRIDLVSKNLLADYFVRNFSKKDLNKTATRKVQTEQIANFAKIGMVVLYYANDVSLHFMTFT